MKTKTFAWLLAFCVAAPAALLAQPTEKKADVPAEKLTEKSGDKPVAKPAAKPATKPGETPEGPANTEAEYQKRYNERITKDRLHGVYIPKNLDDAFVQLDKNISEDSRNKIKAIPEDSVDAVLHNRLGRWMINNWCFYEGSRFSHYLRSAGVTYPDDMADFTIIAYHRHLHNKPVELKELAKTYRETRKKEFLEEQKQGKVIKEEIKKKEH